MTTTQQPDGGIISATHHVIPDDLAPTPEAPETEAVAASAPPEAPATAEVEQPAAEVSVPPELETKYADLDDYFQTKFGAGLNDIFEMLNDLGSFRQQTVYEQQMSLLKNEWGQDFDDRFKVVQAEFAKLPKDQQAAYDTVDGARRLWNDYYVQSGLYRQQPQARANVRTRRVQTAPQNQQSYDYTQAEIEDMARRDPGKYDAERDRITQAYLNGRVKLN